MSAPIRRPSNELHPPSPPMGGLQVPKNIGISSKEMTDILTTFSTQEEVEKGLAEMGIVDKPKPLFGIDDITAEILTTTDSREYTTVYARQLAWYNYISPIYAKACSGLIEAENKLTLIEANIRKVVIETNKLRAKEDRLNAEGINTEVLNDETYQGVLLEVQKMKQYKLRLEAFMENVGRNMKVLSRQVEIKKVEIEGNQREGNLGRGGYAPIRR